MQSTESDPCSTFNKVVLFHTWIMSKINFSCDKYFKVANLLNKLFKKSCAIRSTVTYL